MTDLAVLFENLHANADGPLDEAGLAIERHASALAPADLHAALARATVAGIRSRTKMDEAAFASAEGLQALGCFCIGTNQVDLNAAAARGVPVFNAPFGNTRSVAELTLASIIMLMRGIPARSVAALKGEWRKSAEGSHEVRAKKLGIIGYGNIGSQLSVLASALGMHVYYFDVEPKLAHGNARRVDRLDDLLRVADVVTLHVPDTERTRGMIGGYELALMKQGAMLINHARGHLVDIEALTASLRSGHIGGAAIDVFPVEPASKSEKFETPLQAFENVILTPHIGGSTQEAQAAIGDDVSLKLARYLAEGATKGAVNLPELDPGPIKNGRTRLLSIHGNAPGFMGRLNEAVSAAGANITAQHLETKGEIGYVAADLEGALPASFADHVKGLDGAIRTRLIAS